MYVFLKGASNEEMASRDLQLHPCDTDLENTSLLILIYHFPGTHSCRPKTNSNITLSSLTRAVSAIHKHTHSNTHIHTHTHTGSDGLAWLYSITPAQSFLPPLR